MHDIASQLTPMKPGGYADSLRPAQPVFKRLPAARSPLLRGTRRGESDRDPDSGAESDAHRDVLHRYSNGATDRDADRHPEPDPIAIHRVVLLGEGGGLACWALAFTRPAPWT